MKQVLIRDGKAVVKDVPCPTVEPGCVLVAVEHSCISVGTEMSSVRSSGVPLWRRAIQSPEKVVWVLNQLRNGGLARTRQLVESKVSSAKATGYSAAGRVIAAGPGVEDFRVGDRVACAGGQCAYHAEVICVPVNLAVHIDDRVSTADASTVALGAIALQGVRRASPTLGETFIVIGLGIIGQITVQILRANGCRVVGMDLNSNRLELAAKMGIDCALSPDTESPSEQVARLTGGLGADGVIITAATSSSEVLSTAFKMTRKKGRVVLVGDVGMNISRQDIYAKELDFFISTSYGPGRYDRRYEEEGLDYPAGYVRWTENRNMQAFVDMLASGQVRIQPLISMTEPVDKAGDVYAALNDTSSNVLAALFSYSQASDARDRGNVIVVGKHRPAEDKVRVGIVGAGSFLKGTHLPNLKSLADSYSIAAVVSRSGHNAADTASQVGAPIAATDFQQVVAEPEIDAFIVATRHNLHASMTLAALRAGKHVLCEKPLALSREELAEIRGFYENRDSTEPAPVLLTGFNRRFSPYARKLRSEFADRTNPMIINYRMCGGYTPRDHWIHSAEGGGRNMAEACHIYDLFTYLTGSRVSSVVALPIRPASTYYSPRDNFVATISFDDGSLATLTYTVMGSREHPKEQSEIFCDGKVGLLNDYVELRLSGTRKGGLKTQGQDKGHKAELEEFAECIRSGGEWPIPLWQQLQAMEIALEVETQLNASQAQ